jgi:REP element-mobilizing transposase RayT
MTNHLHLIISNSGNKYLQDTVRDFKKYTSVRIIKSIKVNPFESRKDWMLNLFSDAGSNSNKHLKFLFWQKNFHPIDVTSNYLMEQKLNYIHQNPVKAGFVSEPHHYVYSSAIDYYGGKGLIDVELIQ